MFCGQRRRCTLWTLGRSAPPAAVLSLRGLRGLCSVRLYCPSCPSAYSGAAGSCPVAWKLCKHGMAPIARSRRVGRHACWPGLAGRYSAFGIPIYDYMKV